MRLCLSTVVSLSLIVGAGCSNNAPSTNVLPADGARASGVERNAGPGYAETLLHRFKSSPDAASPEAGVILDASGDLFGTTIAGGAHPDCPGGYQKGCGTVFEIDAAGRERLVYSFAGKPDASEPFDRLLSSNGVLYGTTAVGGNVSACYTYGGDGCGTLFKIDAHGRERLLYQFKGNFGRGNGDGQDPMGGVVSDAAGNLYGSTAYGGKFGYGTVFKVTQHGNESVLYSFSGSTDGGRPYSGVILDAAGNLYGVTSVGGNSGCLTGCGTVFELSDGGTLRTLYRFKGKTDGGNPYGGLIMDATGSLYGTAQNYGNTNCNKRGGNPGCGTVFKLNAQRKFKLLHVFAGSPDGGVPSENLILDQKDDVYGTTSFGGDSSCNGGYSCGVVFEVDAHGHESLLHTFTGGKKDGEVPYGSVTRDAAGNLYGTTVSGGVGPCNRGCGTVFKINRSW
ncbi:MAG: choice-of-anchor tandem repeat GloVer-containing protein [Candidatus Cybelea sp.]